jgi:4a-hydroxytetrahydrobiopterin dehydratase
MERRKLTDEEVHAGLEELNGWQAVDDKLFKRFEFPNFAESLAFVNKAGEIADAADHHPDIRLGWGYAEFDITTHDRGGITPFDIDLAKKIDAIGV